MPYHILHKLNKINSQQCTQWTHLNVILGVPVRVIDDDGVSSSEVDAQPTSSGTQ